MKVAIKLTMVMLLAGCVSFSGKRPLVINYDTRANPGLQRKIDAIDADLRERFAMPPETVAVGVVDLRRMDVAMIHPDRIEYAASVAKIGILLAFFELHPEVATTIDEDTRHELGLMIKSSSNEMAAKYSRAMGLHEIQQVLNACGFYDPARGGGIWVGKHYGPNSERFGDPVADHSHAATVRQLLRFYLLLEQGQLVSPAASRVMREVFASPAIAHDEVKFVKALRGRDVSILRKLGTWQTWLHDTAVVTGPGRHYIIVALTNHPRGDDYLAGFARSVDDLMIARGR